MEEGTLKAIGKYGFATVVAVVLGYVFITDVRGDQKQNRREHVAIVTEQDNLARGILKLADKSGETQMLQEKILGVLRSMCVQNAVTAGERRDCLKE